MPKIIDGVKRIKKSEIKQTAPKLSLSKREKGPAVLESKNNNRRVISIDGLVRAGKKISGGIKKDIKKSIVPGLLPSTSSSQNTLEKEEFLNKKSFLSSAKIFDKAREKIKDRQKKAEEKRLKDRADKEKRKIEEEKKLKELEQERQDRIKRQQELEEEEERKEIEKIKEKEIAMAKAKEDRKQKIIDKKRKEEEKVRKRKEAIKEKVEQKMKKKEEKKERKELKKLLKQKDREIRKLKKMESAAVKALADKKKNAEQISITAKNISEQGTDEDEKEEIKKDNSKEEKKIREENPAKSLRDSGTGKKAILELKEYKRQEKQEKKSQSLGTKNKFKFLLLILLVFIIIFAGSSIFVYNSKPESKLTKFLIDNFPYPAAVVNYNFIRYSDCLDDAKLLKDYYIQIEGIKATEVNDVIMEKNIRKSLLEKLAREYDIKIDPEELTGVGNRGDLSLEIYKEKILYDIELEKEVKQAVIEDEEINKETASKIRKVLKLAQKEKDSFEILAKQYSEGPQALRGGDIGYVKISEMSEQLKKAVENLNKGEVSDVIKEEDKYYIVKVYNIKGAGIKKDYWLKQIVIRNNFDFEHYFEESREEAMVWALVK